VADQLKRFSYTARNVQGQMVTGVIASDSETGAARRLQSMGLAPVSVTSATGKSGGINKNIGPPKKVKPKHLTIFARQFATMSSAGLPLIRSLVALEGQSEHPEVKKALGLIRTDVEAGTSFSVAVSRHPKVFPPLMVGMIAAGEVSGSLGDAMDQVADNYEKEAKLRSKIFAALLYPGVVLGMAFIMVTAMLLFIVPRFTEIFLQLGGELPLPTQMLLLASRIAGIALPFLIVAAIIFAVWWRNHKNDRNVRAVVDPLKLRIPIFGKFFKKIALARFARTFSTLLSSGVPMLQAIDIVSSTAGSIVISDALVEVRSSVRSGKQVASTLQQHPIFPPMAVQMISTGEETGAMPAMLDKVADFYEQEVDTASDALTGILEPILIVLLAVIVGGMVVSLYLPIFQVFQLVQ